MNFVDAIRKSWTSASQPGRPSTKRQATDDEVNSWFDAADRRPKRAKLKFISAEDAIEFVKTKNSYRWWRLNYDYRWLRKTLKKGGYDPEIAKDLL